MITLYLSLSCEHICHKSRHCANITVGCVPPASVAVSAGREVSARGRGVSAQWWRVCGRHPPWAEGRHPRADASPRQTPPWGDPPLTDTLPPHCMLGYTPLPGQKELQRPVYTLLPHCMLGYTPPPVDSRNDTFLSTPSCPITCWDTPPLPWTEGMTQACLNITFPQLLLRAVIKIFQDSSGWSVFCSSFCDVVSDIVESDVLQ